MAKYDEEYGDSILSPTSPAVDLSGPAWLKTPDGCRPRIPDEENISPFATLSTK